MALVIWDLEDLESEEGAGGRAWGGRAGRAFGKHRRAWVWGRGAIEGLPVGELRPHRARCPPQATDTCPDRPLLDHHHLMTVSPLAHGFPPCGLLWPSQHSAFPSLCLHFLFIATTCFSSLACNCILPTKRSACAMLISLGPPCSQLPSCFQKAGPLFFISPMWPCARPCATSEVPSGGSDSQA